MKNPKNFPFHKAKQSDADEIEAFRQAIEKVTGKPRARRGRPPKAVGEKHEMISIRLHPKVLKWAKAEAKKRGVGYQTIIQEVLLKKAG